jgi:hypothetical protein
MTTPQPGYSYGQGARSLKALPQNNVPCVAQLGATLENMARHHDISSTGSANAMDTHWNISVNVVLYRSGKDHIGLHTDNDQGKTVIFTK